MSASSKSVEFVLPHLDRSLETSKMSIIPSLFCSVEFVAFRDQRSPNLVSKSSLECIVLSEFDALSTSMV